MNPPVFPTLVRALLLAGAIVSPLAGCSRDANEEAPAAPSTLITVTEAVARDVPVVFKSMGRLESRASPAVAAEVDGRVLRLAVDEGQVVAMGEVLAELDATSVRLDLDAARADAALLAPGLAVHLRSPLAPEQAAAGVIAEVRPAVGAGNRAIWAVADLANPGGWRPNATVFAEILVATHTGAVVVPARSLVQRPAGEVVYAVRGDRAEQRVVTTGERLGCASSAMPPPK